MTIDQLKWLAILLIFASGPTGGLLPWCLKRNDRFDFWFSLGNSFAGGVFLGIGLIHMMSSATEFFSEHASAISYPVVYLLTGCAFMLFLLLERILVPHDFDEVQLLPNSTRQTTAISAYLLLFMLSVHSFLAGFALGVETTVAGVVIILIALLAHKAVAAFALGISFLRSVANFSQLLIYVLLFSLSTPLGIVAGILIDDFIASARHGVMEGIFYGIAAGTFLYIATLDIFSEEFLRPKCRKLKFLASITGFALMAIVAIWL
ncbi:ZIP family metal transporter [Rubellicoccus peritrichatus]|uniref:ZIP family metal transporter n=1 Tax=Rubellicoccus peritrichatus TaxID=3080537 RepID=A0AAQ3QUM3_9BACT|nr:ZIP family metal transporter [Puniceicoccus sp. CR14]WOO39902.1 ZIP family metal transporter [Puniceicoccus sp. CR14]